MSLQNNKEPEVKPISRRTATIANLVHQYVTIGLAIINGIVLVPLYLKYINFKLYGAWLATGSILAWLGMVDAGLSEIIRQQTAQVYGAKDFKQAGKTIGTGLFCNSAVGLLPVLISLGIAPFLPRIFRLEAELTHSLSSSFVLAGLSCTLVIVSGAAISVQQGLQRNISVCVIFATGSIIGILVTVWMLISGYNLISIPAGLAVRGGFWVIVYWSYLLYFCHHRLHIRLQLSKTDFLKTAGLVGWTFLSRIGRAVVGQCDALVIGLILGVESTPIFVLTKRSWDLFDLILNRISVAFMPGLAHLHGEGDFSKFRVISQRLLRTTTYAAAICVGSCVMFNKAFVALWVGSGLYAGRTFDSLIAISLLSTVFAITVGKVLFAAGDIKGPAVAEIIQNSARLILLIIMVWAWGITGAALSLAISSAAVVVFYFMRKWEKLLQIPFTEFRTSLLSFAKALFVSIALSYLFSIFVVRNNWIWFIGSASINLLLIIGLIYVLDEQFKAEVIPLQAKIKNGFAKIMGRD